MKSRTFAKHLAIFVAAVAAILIACNQGSEGDRCNPDLSHNECGSGLSCTQPALCPETYCCATDGTSTNPYCQTGCSGGAASMCNAGADDAGACAFACKSDPSDLSSSAASACSDDAGVVDAGTDATDASSPQDAAEGG